MTDVAVDDTTVLDDDDPRGSTFESHSAFAFQTPHWQSSEPPLGHDAAHDLVVQTAPVAFDRSNSDDVDRVQHDLMVQLGGAVDAECLQRLLSRPAVPVDDVAPDDLDAWVDRAAARVLGETRTQCGVELFVDAEVTHLLRHAYDQDGWFTARGAWRVPVASMGRLGPDGGPFHVVAAQRHVVGLTSRLALSYTSNRLGSVEYLDARARFPYAPRLDLHPSAVLIARVAFAGVDHWRASVDAAFGVASR